MDVVMRVAGDRRIEQVRLTAGSILDLHGRPRGVMAEADPTDGPRIGTVFPTIAFTSPANLGRQKAHRSIGRAIRRISDHRAFRIGGRKSRRERHGFIRAEDDIEAG